MLTFNYITVNTWKKIWQFLSISLKQPKSRYNRHQPPTTLFCRVLWPWILVFRLHQHAIWTLTAATTSHTTRIHELPESTFWGPACPAWRSSCLQQSAKLSWCRDAARMNNKVTITHLISPTNNRHSLGIKWVTCRRENYFSMWPATQVNSA